MPDQRGMHQARPKPKSPAERGIELAADQARLKQDAADRRAAAAAARSGSTPGR